MTNSNNAPLDSVAAALKEGAARLAGILSEQAELKAQLQASANDADAAGLIDFAEVFRDMAARLGPSVSVEGKTTCATNKRRGRPPKPADDQPPAV